MNNSSQYFSSEYYIMGKSDSWSSLFDGQTGHSGWKLLYDSGSYIDVRPNEHPIDLSIIDPTADENNNRVEYSSNAMFPFDEWGCFVVTFDDYLNTLSFYKNGLLATAFTGTYLDFRTNVQNLFIGNMGYPAIPYVGAIDDIAIYDRALSAAEAGAVCGVFVDLSTATPTATKKPTATPLPSSTPLCAPGWTRLQAGGYAKVSPGDPNRVRSEPRKRDNLIGALNPGTVVKVLEGPICADGLVFWKVENAVIPGGAGWTAEGDGKEYWLEPYKP
jgi:hypothetical protein